MNRRTPRFLASLWLLAAPAAFALSGDPHMPAKPDSRIVRKLMETPIPADPRQVNYVAVALEMLAQPTAQKLHAYLERSEWLAAMDEPPLKAATVGEAIAREEKAEPLDRVRERAFATLLKVELGKPDDVLPEGLRADRARYRQESPWVWDIVSQSADASTRLLHLAITNTGKRDIAGLRSEVIIGTDPPITVGCNPDSSISSVVLAAGQRRIFFCATEWQKKVPAKALAEAAQAVADGRASLKLRPRWLYLHRAPFDLQDGGAKDKPYFARRPMQQSGMDYEGRWQAAALVRESSCFERGTCFAFLASEKEGGIGPLAWAGPAAGLVTFLIVGAFTGFRVRFKAMVIVSVVFALLPVLAFALLIGSKSAGMAALFIPILGAYAWVAWAVGFWGAWLVSLLFRRSAERGEVDDVASRDAA